MKYVCALWALHDSKMDCKSHQSCSLAARIISGSFDLWAHLGTHYEHIITLLHVYQVHSLGLDELTASH